MFWTKRTPANFMPKRVIDALQANFSEHELIELSRFGTPVEVTAGTRITIEGTLGQQAVVIVEGKASVSRNGEIVATVGPGDIVGEIALLSGEPRTATVITDTDATVYALSPRDFRSLMTRCPALERRVASNAVRRITAV